MSRAPVAPASETLVWVERCLGPGWSVVDARRLGGSTGPWLLRVRRLGDIESFVLRDGDPQVETDRLRFGVESAALRVAEVLQVAAPRLVGDDLTGASASRLAILSTHLPGDSTIPLTATRERLLDLGRAAASLCRIPPAGSQLPVRARPLADLDFASERAIGDMTPLLHEADDFVAAFRPPVTSGVLVHGDCWQGNMLWHNGRFTGFVDWDAAGVGQPGLDLANLRFDVALYFGLDGLGTIADGWAEAGGLPVDHMAYWDVVAALSSPTDLAAWTPTITEPGRPDLDSPTLTTRRDDFLEAALRSAGH